MGGQYFNYIILGIAVLLFLVTLIKDWRPFAKKNETQKSDLSTTRQKPVDHNNTTQSKGNEQLTFLCLQAYERLIVFLERIKLAALIRRIHRSDLDVQETERWLINHIRSEFEHNISQQIYVSTASWEAVSSAKEQLIRYIHIDASKFSAQDDGNVLRKELLSRSFPNDESPVSIALDVLNSEAKKFIAVKRRD